MAIRSVLVIRPDALGDAVLTLPMIAELHRLFPKAHIRVICRALTQPLFAEAPGVSETILDWRGTEKGRGLKGFFSYVRFLKSFSFDAVVMPFMDGYYAALCAFAGIPIRIGDGNKPLIRPFLTHAPVLRYRDLSTHVVEQNLRLLAPLKNDLADGVFQGAMAVASESDVRPFLDRFPEVRAAMPIVGIHPSSGGHNRVWMPEQYAAFIDWLHTHTPYTAVLTGAGAKEVEIGRQIVTLCQTRPPIQLGGKLELKDLQTLIRQCRVFMGSDTGPVHLAAALQAPVLGLSPTKFVKALHWGPWNTPNEVVNRSEVCALTCNPVRCRLSDCVAAISLSDVTSAFERVLKQEAPSIADSKQKWFQASGQVVFALTDSEPASIQTARHYAALLKSVDVRYRYLFFSTRARDVFLADGPVSSGICTVIPLWRVDALTRFLIAHNVLVVQLIPGNYRRYFGLLRQWVALSVYSPPVMVTQAPAVTTPSALIAYYLSCFKG